MAPTALGERAERMAASGGFLGVPVAGFEEAGRRQLVALLRLGLGPHSKVLDLGCGCLRGGYWLIHFLAPDGYCGIEPHRGRVKLGLDHLLEPEVARHKRPRFDYNSDFGPAGFGERFDFFLARSIWSHASKPQIRSMLDSFVGYRAPGAAFLTSYLPAGRLRSRDYRGTEWVGTSHLSEVPGIVHHRRRWIAAECRRRGLAVRGLQEEDFGGQRWLVIR